MSITVIQPGKLVPTEEFESKKIDIKECYGNTYRETIVNILKKIIAYNTDFIQHDDKAYRFMYMIRTANGIYQPTFEQLDPSENVLIISVLGEPLKREDHMELIDVGQIIGLASESFKLGDFDLNQVKHNTVTIQTQKNTQRINSMYGLWSKMSLTVKGRIIQFFKDLEEINQMREFNKIEFFRSKRMYIYNFIMYLDSLIKNPNKLDNTIEYDEVKRIREEFKVKIEDVNF